MAKNQQHGNVFDRHSGVRRPEPVRITTTGSTTTRNSSQPQPQQPQQPQQHHTERDGVIASTGTTTTTTTTATSAAVDDKKSDNDAEFDPREPFLLSELIANLDNGDNFFQFPAGAQVFLRRVLSEGPNFQFLSMNGPAKCTEDGDGHPLISTSVDNNNRVAFISSCLNSRDIYINLDTFSPQRVGEAICHELLHHEDFGTSGFRPISSLVYCRPAGLRGAAPEMCADAPTREFQPMIGKLVNLISHQYVKAKLEEFGYVKPFVPAMRNQLTSLRFTVQNLEATMKSLSEQVVKILGVGEGARMIRKKPLKIGIYKLQSVFEDIILAVLTDELLFDGEYADQIHHPSLLDSFQNVLDYILSCTSSDGEQSFHRVYRQVDLVAALVRDACTQYRSNTPSAAIVGDAADRYTLLVETLNSAYNTVGVQFSLLAHVIKDEAPSIRIETTSNAGASGMLRQEDTYYSLDGEYTFDGAKAFEAIT
mmetsp:Transcript_4260/g.9058  ORF Transcript_4260/g.9058 Transcript_4260/m.9058 type:complete len:480 (-) Transcript_4260:86-1525(-)